MDSKPLTSSPSTKWREDNEWIVISGWTIPLNHNSWHENFNQNEKVYTGNHGDYYSSDTFNWLYNERPLDFSWIIIDMQILSLSTLWTLIALKKMILQFSSEDRKPEDEPTTDGEKSGWRVCVCVWALPEWHRLLLHSLHINSRQHDTHTVQFLFLKPQWLSSSHKPKEPELERQLMCRTPHPEPQAPHQIQYMLGHQN